MEALRSLLKEGQRQLRGPTSYERTRRISDRAQRPLADAVHKARSVVDELSPTQEEALRDLYIERSPDRQGLLPSGGVRRPTMAVLERHGLVRVVNPDFAQKTDLGEAAAQLLR